MASIYTHHYFGRQLQKKCKDKSWARTRLFLFGQQGPDLFFFHLGFVFRGKNPGMVIHNDTCANYIERNLSYLRKLDRESDAYGYFIGTICHFILDAHLHPMVDKLESKDYLHMDIESELDRYYMMQEGMTPNSLRLSALLPPKSDAREVAVAITPFYQSYGVNVGQVYSSIIGFRRWKDFFYTTTAAREKRIESALRLLRLRHYSGQMIRQKPFEESVISNEILSKGLEIAFALTPEFIDNVEGYIQGKESLDKFFYKNYNGK